VSPSASDQEVRAAYHRLVKLHHPDHNGGSAESARRFEEVQEAYARIRERRKTPRTAPNARQQERPSPHPPSDDRLHDLERQVREAQRQREEAQRRREEALRAAREAVLADTARPSDEELGYVKTEDSFSKILADALDELADKLKRPR
jgi:molecular chaperone DnaJ